MLSFLIFAMFYPLIRKQNQIIKNILSSLSTIELTIISKLTKKYAKYAKKSVNHAGITSKINEYMKDEQNKLELLNKRNNSFLYKGMYKINIDFLK